jgi:three-Cys-motif partner protein
MARQAFGGDWTQEKLNRVSEYLHCYNKALKNQRFRREYIDAFAGTGYREAKSSGTDGDLMFPEIAEPEVQGFLDGSARIALKVEPPFHNFVFIEKHAAKVKELEKLKHEFSNRAISVKHEEANICVQELCRESWNNRRAVLFLDPFGMQVSWQTLVAVAGTKSIDTWLLFPLGVAISRLLRHDGEIEESLCERLDFVFGDRSWREAFYKVVPRRQATLDFGESPEPDYPWRADFTVIEEYFKARLRTIFAGVAKNSVRLLNSKNIPLYLLFFMAGNERGAPIAVKIAESIMSR